MVVARVLLLDGRDLEIEIEVRMGIQGSLMSCMLYVTILSIQQLRDVEGFRWVEHVSPV